MAYRKPGSKSKANENYLHGIGFEFDSSPYQQEEIEQNKTFLIVCEGENTEPEYFKAFPVPSKFVLIEGGCGSKSALVDYALKIKDNEKYSGRELWCVFDYDVKPDEAATQLQDFNSAIEKAQANGMKIAWSNDAFELWFVLHYQKLDAPLTRYELYLILKKEWNLESFSKEAKKRGFCKEHYERHGGDKSKIQAIAVRRARELHKQFEARKDYSSHCPCTTVYQLVEELNKYLR